MAFEDIAVLVRSDQAGELTAQVFADYGIPVARERRAALASTRLGSGLLAFARAALGSGSAMDVVTWLRTPGKLAEPDAADRLEAAVLRNEARAAAEARRLWERGGGRPLAELEAVAAADAAAEVLA